LDLGIVQQRLEPADAVERGVDAVGQLGLLGVREGRATGGDLLARVRLQAAGDDRPGELALVLAGHGGQAGGGVLATLAGQRVGDLLAQGAQQLRVHQISCPTTGRPAKARMRGTMSTSDRVKTDRSTVRDDDAGPRRTTLGSCAMVPSIVTFSSEAANRRPMSSTARW